MEKTHSLLTIVAVIGAMIAPATLAAGPRPGRQDRGDTVGPIRKALNKLDLTDKQKADIKGILEANRQAIEQARDAKTTATKAYAEAVKGGDEASIRSAGAAVGKAMADLAVIRVQVAGAVKAVLTPEQLQQWEAMKERAHRSASLGDGNGPARNGRARPLALLSRDKVFNRIDRNGDGAITIKEVRALRRHAGAAKAEAGQAQ